MSSAAQITANTINAQSSTGPRSEAGQATSSKNAITHGLFTAKDFIRPHEQADYDEIGASLRNELAPVGTLEHNLVDEMRRAIWRLDRCGKVEGSMILPDPDGAIPDPMQMEAFAKLQLSVDRARSQAHRLLHKCTAELRKLQTERRLRDESFEAGADLSQFGLCDWAFIRKALDAQFIAGFQRRKLQGTAEIEAMLSMPLNPPAQSGSFCKTESTPVPASRNASPMRDAA